MHTSAGLVASFKVDPISSATFGVASLADLLGMSGFASVVEFVDLFAKAILSSLDKQLAEEA